MYLEYPLVLVQQSILFYYVLNFKRMLNTDTVLLSMLTFLTIILFITEILPKFLLAYLIVNISQSFFKLCHLILLRMYRFTIQIDCMSSAQYDKSIHASV